MSNRKMKVMKVRGPRQNSRNRQGSARRSGGNRSIPMISSNVKGQHRFRFIASAAISAVSILTGDVLKTSGLFAVTTTTLYPVNKTFRLKSVEVWAPTATSTTGAICSIEWPTNQTGPTSEVSDISINVSEPAHIIAIPPKDSIASFWQQDGTTSMFILTCPGGSVVDISIDYVQDDDGVASSFPITVVGATAGTIYYGFLDGDATHLLTPVSLRSIF
jgi:hypothetical protein